MVTQELLNWSLGIITVFSGGYAAWVNRKSRKFKEAEEGEKFIDSAVKLTDVWEKLSANLQTEIGYLRGEAKDMLEKYTQLRIDFEVTKSNSEFIIQRLNLDLELVKAERDNYKAENQELRQQLGVGVVKKLNG